MNRIAAVFLLLSAGIILVCGCRDSVAVLDGRDRGNLMVRSAVEKMKSGNIEGALHLYAEALDRYPKLAVAHMDMAIILHDKRKDYLRAIYHYERYLELRPATEKKRIIQDRIRLAGLSYAAKIAEDGSAVAEAGKLANDVAKLKKENDILRESVKQLNLQLLESKNKPTDAAAVDKKVRMALPVQDDAPAGMPDLSSKNKTQKATTGSSAVRTHTIKRGDSLRSIALEYYRDAGKADDILEANRDKIGSAHQLKIGQILVLP